MTARRVLVVTNMYPPHHYGGYELVCQEAVEELRARGHHVEVLTSDLRVPGRDAHADGGGVDRTLRLYWREHRVLSPPLREALSLERWNQGVVAAALERVRPDVVSVWAMGALSLGVLARIHRSGVPVVHVVNDDWLVYGTDVDTWASAMRKLGPAASIVERLTGVPSRLPDLGATGSWLFVSDATLDAARRHGRWRPSRPTVVYGGVNTRQFDPADARPREAWRWRLACISRIDPRKGLDTALQAFADLPEEATLEITGRGEDEHLDELRQLAHRLGVEHRVVFSAAERPELAARYRRADAFLFTPRWSEPFGLTPLEAMACATPVVATAVGGAAEYLVHERNALLVPPGDAGAVAAAVRRLADDPGLRARLVEGGLATVEELGMAQWFDVVVAWHEAAASRFVDGRPAPRPPIGDVLRRRLAAG